VKIGDSVQQGWTTSSRSCRADRFLLILLIGYIVAGSSRASDEGARGVRLDHALHSGSTGEYVNKVAPTSKPSRTIGAIAFWFVFLGAISIAVSQLGIAALTDFVAAIAAYLPNVVAAILIFVIAGAIAPPSAGSSPAPWATRRPARSSAPSCRAGDGDRDVHDPQPAADRAGDRDDHLRRVIGGVFLAMALAFGLGGREVAAQMLGDAYDKGREQRARSRTTCRRARSAPRTTRRRVKAEAETRTGAGNGDIDKPSGASGVRRCADGGPVRDPRGA
jgi:hypothetical protein